MTTRSVAAEPFSPELPGIRTIGTSDLDWALREGWKDFREKRGDLLFAGLIYPVVCVVAIVVTFNAPLLPLFFPLLAGLSIAGPAVAAGFYELARRREEGRDENWWHFLDPLKGRSRMPLAVLTFALGVVFVLWLAAAYAIYALTFGVETSLTITSFTTRIFTTTDGWAMIALGNLVGLGFAVVALVIGVVSFPMVVDQPVDAGYALRTSIAASRANQRAVFGWGIRVAGLLFLGTLAAGIGLAIVLPVLGYATWHLYTRLIVR